MAGTLLVVVPIDSFILMYLLILNKVALDYCMQNAPGFNVFHKQKTEAPIELAISMFTDFLLDYVQ